MLMPDPLSLAERLQKEKAVIKGAPVSFATACLIILVGCFGACSAIFYFHYNGTFSQKDATIETQTMALDRADKENARLERRLAEASIPRGESGIPLKKRVTILSEQLEEFAKQIEGPPVVDINT